MIESKNRHQTAALNPIMLYTGLVLLFIIAFFPVIRGLVGTWIHSDDNSHGLLILPVSLYIIWQNRANWADLPVQPGRGGKSLVVLTILFYILSYKAGIATLSSLSLVLTIWAVVWALFGKAVFKAVLFPLALLLLMIPVPAQFFSMATIPLQLMVSKVSAVIVRLFDVPVLREGNVIHLPGRTLEVVQACSGLRSLMSLVTLCAIFGYLTLSSNVLRGILIVSSIPAAVLVNIFRVVMMILSIHYMDFDLTGGTPHTVFGVIVFLLALSIVAGFRGILSKWDKKQTDS
ncbi:exosortase A [Desulfosarcina widdelii]|uniref:Exosortase A n=1 Tax=Desulfosarcina widdelii TaxID=947919 RepID=A0A5K7YYG5_9BACT|nr:exosortase/archaeosortase family protein [Desulfosarcina widdelii]BBO72963.1 exosortase A [Desulfosarcina widdelii]